MPQYNYRDESGNNSGYESDEGTYYQPQKELGSGTFSRARKFQSITGKTRAVIAPLSTKSADFKEVETKYQFFKALYPDKDVRLFKRGTTYRLIAPLISGERYDHLSITSPEELINIFLSAIEVLINCHNKGCIVVDLKEDNIYYDTSTNKSFLIDGGISVRQGEYVDPIIFKAPTAEAVKAFREKYYHIAPECWSTAVVRAHAAMDIYSLGNMMARVIRKRLSTNPDRHQLLKITDSCQRKDISQRPSLDALRETLLIMSLPRRIKTLPVNFEELKTGESIKSHKNALLTNLRGLRDEHARLKIMLDSVSFKAKEREILRLAEDRKFLLKDAGRVLSNAISRMRKIIVDFSDKKTSLEIEQYRVNLRVHVANILLSFQESCAFHIVNSNFINQHVDAKIAEIEEACFICKERVERISNKLKRVDDILLDLENKINGSEFSQSSTGREEANRLLTKFKDNRASYSTDLHSNNTEESDNLAFQYFQAACLLNIQQAKPILENDLRWGWYLANLTIKLLNITVGIVTAGYYNCFFKPIESNSMNEVDLTAESLGRLHAAV